VPGAPKDFVMQSDPEIKPNTKADMASFSTTATITEPEISRDDHGTPDYGTRLRRARLGLFVALIPVLMLFVSFTSAYVVRQGLPTLDPRTNNFVRDWIPVRCRDCCCSIRSCCWSAASAWNWRGGKSERERLWRWLQPVLAFPVAIKSRPRGLR